MSREAALLLLATAAVIILAYYVLAVTGGFLPGAALGILVVYVLLEWKRVRGLH